MIPPNIGDLSLIHISSWRYANQDKTRDQRRKGNKINWKNSCLMIDSYKIFMKNPMQMVRLVRHLREEGYEILPCAIEIEKKRLLRKSDDTYRSGSSRELHKRFQEDPFSFEEYCAALFRAMGKRAHTTPRTNDGGYDVIVSDNNGLNGIVECKCYAPDSKAVSYTHLLLLMLYHSHPFYQLAILSFPDTL